MYNMPNADSYTLIIQVSQVNRFLGFKELEELKKLEGLKPILLWMLVY